ncbi:hypothetical protein BSL78_23088 [Apostichopus japonicus]|uniref:Uncharacterized protein n=1 Tax=Stichopus japonicus TaxID=307972 RepID=A0A2G8JWH0_STIJA|nr:hypothetical protein BSL78_23088 [Apostichopus japonicus]
MENCRSCKQFRPFKAWDKHDLCPKCRPCGSKQTCSICQDWTQERWDLIGTWLADKAAEKRKKAASSKQGKKKPPAKEPQAAIRDGISPKHGGTEGAIRDGSNPPQERVSIRDGANSRAASAQPRPRPQEGPSTSGHVESRSPQDKRWRTYLLQLRGRDHNRRDFSGFSPESTERRQSRSRSRSRRRSRERHRRPRRRSRSGSSPSSSSGHSSGRHRAKKRKRRQSPDPGQALLSQVKDLLGQFAKSRVNRTRNNKGLRQFHHNRRHRQHRLRTISPLRRPRQIPGTTSPPELMTRCQSQLVPASSVETPRRRMKNPYGVQKFRRKPLRRRRQYSAESSASRKGWMRGPRGAGIQTHFERGPQKPRASIPVDVECRERFEAVAQAKRWTAFQRSAHRTFHVGDEDWESLFTPPQIPPQVKERLRSAGALDGKDKFREKGAQTLESSLFDVDRASRAGMKYSSALLLFAELLNRSFQQAQASGISRKDTAAIIALLGPVSRMVLDQFARVSVKATLTRRDLV